jgi:hypothetical protein
MRDKVRNYEPERRRRGRVPVQLLVRVIWKGQEIPVVSRNLSLKGLACSPDPLLRENACCEVTISLSPNIQAVVKGRIVRAREDEAAIDFLAMDLESFIHLKKIVEYQSQHPEAVSRELLNPAFPLSRSRTPFIRQRPRK